MSHLATPANTKIAAGAPGLTGTSPGQDIGTAKVQDQSNTRQELKNPHDHVDKSTKPTSSKSQTKLQSEETKPKIGSKDSLDVVTEPPVRASTPTPSGAPGATGASPNQPFGGDERDASPRRR
ncbi:hypothetical protein E2P81_ATG07903 [Venturia nashicola]|uniref:Uncharacterized protein n=1 Tax=Venturia nashicola TaxID=86259 RepID=A0A4Z1NS80_9PEZI|nr:hypothetical protein E6O75_ATG08073 [Venturia nashicola]TLD26091.1 hypothetical protein E2P81_ATG07903 [Venturia nashicola]